MSERSAVQLINTAQQEGTLSMAATKVLKVVDIGKQIEAALGVRVGDVASSEVVLVSKLIDDSGSIRFGSNAQLVRDGNNLVDESLKATKQADSILAHTKYLNGTILYDYRPIQGVPEMTSQNYDPNGGTPLYDQTVVFLGTVLAKTQEFLDNGVAVRTISLIVSDGADQHSNRYNERHCAQIVRDMLKPENRMHIIAAMGIDDGRTDFRKVFSDMGIPDEWILTPGNSAHDIRKAFQLFSQSAVRASQAAHFSSTSLDGFTN